MNKFSDDLQIPTTEPDCIKELDAPLSLEKLKTSIQSMQSNKAPGPDRLPIEFFKKFMDKLSPLLLLMFKESLEKGTLPPTLTQASIAPRIKGEKDPTQCSSYRPLSLLNADVRILAKALAICLEKVLPSILSEKQTGFIKGRHIFLIAILF